ncbi:MAG: CPBP family intramembrane glutamic endopeptidase, partial [Nocardioidaceae bacterium]
RAVAAAAVGCSLLTAGCVALGPWPLVVVALPVLAWAGRVGARERVPELLDAALVPGALFVLLLVPGVRVWPLAPLLALGLTAGLLARRGDLGRWRSWLRLGRVDRTTLAIVLGVQVVSVVALLVWTRLFDGVLPDVYADAARDAGAVPAAVGGLLFLVVNGLVEDSLFFGVLLGAAQRALAPAAALTLSAAVFGLAHLHGIPNGPVGVLMAGSWAVMLAALRLRTGGMLATYAAHIVADSTIVVMLLPAALGR